MYSYKNGYNTSVLELDDIFKGTTTGYLHISKLTGEKNEYGRLLMTDYKWFIETKGGKYRETTDPYKDLK